VKRKNLIVLEHSGHDQPDPLLLGLWAWKGVWGTHTMAGSTCKSKTAHLMAKEKKWEQEDAEVSLQGHAPTHLETSH
jgi:hypothetical protein